MSERTSGESIPSTLELEVGNQKTQLIRTDGESADLEIHEDEPTEEKIVDQAKYWLCDRYWWLTEWSQNLGELKEKWQLNIGENQSIYIYNYFRPLLAQETDQIASVFGRAQLYLPGYIGRVEDIVISSKDRNNDKSGQPMNGNWLHTDPHRAMALYPAMFEDKTWRVSGKQTSFSGIMMHELGHTVGTEIRNEWARSFNWRGVSIDPSDRKFHPGGGIIYEVCDEPQRCVTDYAKADAYEDLAESFSAYVYDPEILDPPRLDYLRENFPQRFELQKDVRINKLSQEETHLPTLPERMTYIIKPQLVHLIKKT